jgi:hypothetical protein
MDGCEPPCGCWDLNSGPSEEQSVLLTAEPSLQPLNQFLNNDCPFYAWVPPMLDIHHVGFEAQTQPTTLNINPLSYLDSPGFLYVNQQATFIHWYVHLEMSLIKMLKLDI